MLLMIDNYDSFLLRWRAFRGSMAALQPRERLGPLLLAHSPNDDVFRCAVRHEQAEGDAHHLTAFREIGQPL